MTDSQSGLSAMDAHVSSPRLAFDDVRTDDLCKGRHHRPVATWLADFERGSRGVSQT
jgi:hypothetical protein